jgi:2'-5' RNA ligase
VADVEPFPAVAHGAGAFPTVARPRTVWLGIEEGEGEFVKLHDALEKALGQLGFRHEGRRFRPHMTIGRVRQSPHGVAQLGEKIAENAHFDAGEMQVSEIILFSSSLDRQGPSYQILGRATLGSQ